MSAFGPYSALKILHHPDRVALLRVGQQIVPTQVQLILSDLCNHACGFCAYRMPGYDSNELFKVIDDSGHVNNNPNRKIPTPKALEILQDCRDMGVAAIQFTGGGEPTVHPDHHAIFQAALHMGMEIALVTNGDRLSDATIQTLGRAAWVRVSLDAGTSLTYSKIRRVHRLHFDRVLENIHHLAESRSRHGSTMQLGVGFVVTAENWHEIRLAAALAKRAGANNFRISGVFTPDNFHYHAPFFEEAVEVIDDAKNLTDDKFTVIDLYHNRMADLQEAAPDYPTCGYMQFTTYIGADLNVYTCCNNAYNPRGLIGSLQQQTFRELWEGDAKHQFFQNFDARGCPRCMFHDKNRLLHYLTEPQPMHANFV